VFFEPVSRFSSEQGGPASRFTNQASCLEIVLQGPTLRLLGSRIGADSRSNRVREARETASRCGEDSDDIQTRIRQAGRFRPRGLLLSLVGTSLRDPRETLASSRRPGQSRANIPPVADVLEDEKSPGHVLATRTGKRPADDPKMTRRRLEDDSTFAALRRSDIGIQSRGPRPG
jgi:hypothetical protein